MVGFASNPSIKLKEEELVEIKAEKSLNPPTPDFSFELEEDPEFADSFLNFDCLNDWIQENPEPCMAEFQEDGTNLIELGVAEEGVDGESLGKIGSLIEEGMGKVSLEGGVVKEEHVGVDGSGGVSGEMVDVKSEVMVEEFEVVGVDDAAKSCDKSFGDMVNVVKSEVVEEFEVGCVNDGCAKSCESLGVDGDAENKGEMVCVAGDGEVGGGDVSGEVNGNKVSLEGKKMNSGVKVSDEGESDSASESESESSSSASASSSSSSSSEEEEEEEEEDDDDDDDDDDEEEEGEMDVEEGEIREKRGEETIGWSDEDDEYLFGVKAGPIMSKNEIKVLPPVPSVEVTLQSHHQTLPVGAILSIVGAQVIVEGVEKHNPLNEGSILWITEMRLPLGIVDEIFGPVKNPYYMVRYNSDSEVPTGIREGTSISFVPEFANHVLNDASLYKKGYDASNENDEELSDEVEFSDDEKEVEYKRMQKMSKRGTKDNNVEKKKGKKSKFRSRGGQQESDQPSPAKLPTTGGGKVPFNQGQHSFQSAAASMNQGNSLNYSAPAPTNLSGPGGVSVFPQQDPPFAPPSSGIWANGIQSQQQAPLGFPNGIPNNMPWMQQQPYQMPLLNAMQFQHQFNAGQMLPPNFVLPGGQQESDQPSPAKLPTTGGGKVPFNQGQHSFQSAAASMNQGNSLNYSAPAPTNLSGPGGVSVFPQQDPPFAPPSSGIWANGIQSQQQAPLGFPNGIPNNMPWMQQQPYQMPLLNAMQFQHQFNAGQMLPPNFVLPGGQPGFGAGPTFLPWNPMLIAQNSFNQLQAAMAMQGQHALPSMKIGEQGGPSSGFQIEQNGNFQPPSVIPGNNEASQNFNLGGNFGRGKKPNRRGGRFGGGRGRLLHK